jgi:hypothetical protein
MSSRLAVKMGTVIGLLYGVSWLLPAFTTRVLWGDSDFSGWDAFFWAGIDYRYWPTWAANPVMWFGMVKLFNRRWKAARNAGLIAVVLACSQSDMFPSRPDVGYYVWLSSMAALAATGWVGQRQEQRMANCFEKLPQPDDTAIRVLR